MKFQGSFLYTYLRIAALLAGLAPALSENLVAQPTPSAQEDAEARIFIIQELSLNRIQDLNFGSLLAGELEAEVDARTNPNAGKLVLHFDDSQEWTVRAQASDELVASSAGPGSTGLSFDPEIFGHPTDNPGNASPVEPDTGRYRTQDDRFYFWIGGSIEAANAVPGVYTGTFTLTVEAI